MYQPKNRADAVRYLRNICGIGVQEADAILKVVETKYLRDEFAMRLVQLPSLYGTWEMKQAARNAYAMADAMLKVRDEERGDV